MFTKTIIRFIYLERVTKSNDQIGWKKKPRRRHLLVCAETGSIGAHKLPTQDQTIYTQFIKFINVDKRKTKKQPNMMSHC